MEQELLKRMLVIAQRSGEIALNFIEDSSPVLKPDTSVLTKADLAVSSFIREQIKDLLATQEHILVDEEDKENSKYFDQELLERIPYVWVVDPIDGTRSFSNRMPLFGISIGVLKNLQPWMSVVYFPVFQEMFYSDGQKAYFVQKAFTPQAVEQTIVPVDQSITRQSVFFVSDAFFREFEWDLSFCQIMLPSCAVIDLCWPAGGRGCGCTFNSNIWDFAGSWPIFQAADLHLRSLATGKVLDRIHVDLFEGKGSRTWKLKEQHILSSRRNFPLIKRNILPKS